MNLQYVVGTRGVLSLFTVFKVCELTVVDMCAVCCYLYCCVSQACRGSNLDHGVELEADADVEMDPKIYRIPAEADFLYAYSTVPGWFCL